MRKLEDHYWWFVSRRNLALRLLKNRSQPDHKILDVGCGTGALLHQIQQQFWAAGLDFSHHALSFSRQRGLKHLLFADAQSIPLNDGSFDTVISLDTIEHVPNDAAAISEIFRVLKPGGTIIMNVPAFSWLWGPHDVALMHYRRYHRRQVIELLTQSGFQIEKCSYSVFFLFPVVVLRRAFEKLQRGEPKVRLPRVSRFTNTVLEKLMELEASLFVRLNLPWGSSVVAVATKPN
ncbi:methyltransferase domain-containing protein [Kamptonema cortianum]|nr:methyltransferase domain-containing protein [Geitlerinema splendidum]MDK3161209.1 methyltransferase domain-containing protein [Kamptonema cortianum]